MVITRLKYSFHVRELRTSKNSQLFVFNIAVGIRSGYSVVDVGNIAIRIVSCYGFVFIENATVVIISYNMSAFIEYMPVYVDEHEYESIPLITQNIDVLYISAFLNKRCCTLYNTDFILYVAILSCFLQQR